MLKALEDDPTVFEYDSLYDDMQEQKKRADPRLVKKDKSVCSKALRFNQTPFGPVIVWAYFFKVPVAINLSPGKRVEINFIYLYMNM